MSLTSRQDIRHSLPPATGLTEDDLNRFVTINTDGEFVRAEAGEYGFPLLAVEGRQGATAALNNKQKIVLGATLNPGVAVTSSANGRAVAATAGDYVNGILLEGGAEDEVVSFLVVHFQADTA